MHDRVLHARTICIRTFSALQSFQTFLSCNEVLSSQIQACFNFYQLVKIWFDCNVDIFPKCLDSRVSSDKCFGGHELYLGRIESGENYLVL